LLTYERMKTLSKQNIFLIEALPPAWMAEDRPARHAGHPKCHERKWCFFNVFVACVFIVIEAAIISIALRITDDWPLSACCGLAALLILPIAVRGLTRISRFDAASQRHVLALLQQIETKELLENENNERADRTPNPRRPS